MRNPNRIRKTAEDHVINTACVVFGVLLALACIYPIYYTLINSLNEGADAARGGIYLWPRVFSLHNYAVVFKDDDLPMSFLVTVLRTLTGTVLALLFTTAVSYALSRKELIGRKFYLYTGMITMYVSGGVIPTYMLYRSMGLINSFWVYIWPSLYSFGNAILMLNFFKKLPDSLIESAKIDGAQEFTILLKIILPLSKPLLATIALFLCFGYWNDWFLSSLYISDSKLVSLQALLNNIMRSLEYMTNNPSAGVSLQQYRAQMPSESVRMAIAIVIVIPIACAYPFFQKYFISGLTIGAVKG